jgi:hypothetical protein
MTKNASPHKNQFVPNSFKYLLVVSSLAGTLGVWNLLANKDLVNADTNKNFTELITSTVDPSTLPTIVPLLKVDLSQVQSNAINLNKVQATEPIPLREVVKPNTAPINQPSAPLIVDNSSASASLDQNPPAVNPPAGNPPVVNPPVVNPPAIIPPDPITVTQTSKP